MRVNRVFWLPFVQDRISVARHVYRMENNATSGKLVVLT